MLNLNYGGVEVVRLHLSKDKKYPDGMRCRMIIQAPEGKRLMMMIEDLDLDANTVFRNNQNMNTGAQITSQACGNGDYALFIDGSDENGLPLLGMLFNKIMVYMRTIIGTDISLKSQNWF